MPYSSDHKARTRARIVEAALKLFNSIGYEATTIDRVMAEAGLTRGGFYSHFATKEALFAAAVAAAGRTDLAAKVVPMLKAEGRLDVSRLARAYLDDRHRFDPGKGCALVATAGDVIRAGAEAKTAYATVFEGLSKLLGRAGADEGERDGLVALLVGTVTVMRALPETEQGDAVRRSALALIDRLFAREIGEAAAE
ncbi:MAG: TetR/AcrR family transcriptional regulator [Siculibacillus sp.]|nr:TetR/AcrR family transcriptional regulator [Siculibacillus sp.]